VSWYRRRCIPRFRAVLTTYLRNLPMDLTIVETTSAARARLTFAERSMKRLLPF